jgi:hypothetical protein
MRPGGARLAGPAGLWLIRAPEVPGHAVARVDDVDPYYELVDCTEPWQPPLLFVPRLGNCGHISDMERPQDFNRALGEFLACLPPP